MNFDWKTIVKNVAPALGTALGGPVAGVATKFIADKLLGNSDASEQDIANAVMQANPEQMAKLRELDLNFAIEMGKQGVDIYRIDAEDRASARQREANLAQAGQKDYTPLILACTVSIGFFSLLFVIAFDDSGIPDSVINILSIMMGTLATAFIGIINYYFGSSSSSRNKDIALIGKFNGESSVKSSHS